jgi:adenylate cyclase
MNQHKTYAVLFGLLYLIVIVTFWLPPPWAVDLRNFVFDTYQRLDPPAYDPASPVRILAIDERSLETLGQWPWPRSRLAEMIAKLAPLGPSAVAFDVVFSEPDRVSLENVLDSLPDGPLKADLRGRISAADSNDARFAAAIAQVPVVLSVTATDRGPALPWPTKAGMVVAGDAPDGFLPDFSAMLMPVAPLREAATGLGATNWLPDRDQVVRRVPLVLRYGAAVVPSLAMEALRVAQGASTYVLRGSNASGTSAFGRQTGLNAVKVGDIAVDTGADGSVRPRYTHTAPERYISVADLFAGKVAADDVRGRILVVGTPVVGLGDVRATPLDAVVPGVEVHAQVLEQLLSGKLLSRPDWAPGAEFVATLLVLTLMAATLARMSPALGAGLSMAAVGLVAATSWTAFSRHSLLLDPALPSLAIGTAYLSGASALWQTEQQAQRQVRRAFGKFVSPAVVSRIAANPKLLVLSGETRELSILFSDLRSFSTISESLTAPEVAEFLNGYLTPMTDVVLQHEGTIDKYIGDAIVAFWNAPLDIADHPRRAVEASLAMREALVRFNADQARRAEHGEKVVRDIRMGVGLNVGFCSVGNMGSLQRFDYSALGDPMNVAARLEALTKSYGIDILATAAVTERVPDFAWLEIDAVKVKGRATPTQLFAVLGDEAHAASDAFRSFADQHGRMLAASRSGRSEDAAAMARTLAAIAEPQWRPLYENLAGRYAEAARHEAAGEPGEPGRAGMASLADRS